MTISPCLPRAGAVRCGPWRRPHPTVLDARGGLARPPAALQIARRGPFDAFLPAGQRWLRRDPFARPLPIPPKPRSRRDRREPITDVPPDVEESRFPRLARHPGVETA